jgi:2-polyprenyl-3-methyl-5-hydroxy-6-metoxy-1,4-benzoquinol methylase
LKTSKQDYERKDADYFQCERTDLISFFGRKAERVLDVGCGAGANADLYRSVLGARYLGGIEILPEAAEQAKKRFDAVRVGPVEETLSLFSGEKFDLIVCADVLEHLVDPWDALRRLQAVSRPGASLLCSVPNVRHYRELAALLFKGEWEYRDAGIMDRTHLRFFTRKTIRRLLESTGWIPERWSHNPLEGKGALLRTLSFNRLTDFLVTQYYVVARQRTDAG